MTNHSNNLFFVTLFLVVKDLNSLSLVYYSFQFLHNMGMPKLWAMTDVFGLDDELLAMIPQPVSALLLLFPINNKVFFTHYTIWKF